MATRWFENRFSYRTRLLAVFAFPWLLTTVFSFLYLARLQTAAGEANARQHLGIVSDMLAVSVASGLSEADFSMVQKAFEWSRFDENVVYIGIIDERGEVIYQTGPSPSIPTGQLTKESMGISMTPGGLLSVTPVKAEGKDLGTVVLLYSLAGVERGIRSALMTSALVSILVLLAGLWGARLLVRQAVELETARAEAERQTATVRAQADVLVRTNASLAESNEELYAMQMELRRAHDYLERRVEERTTELARANAELRLNQAHLSVAMMAARMAPWKLDLATGELTLSGTLFGMNERSANTTSGLLTLVHEEDRGHVIAALERATKSFEPLEVEFRVRLEDGALAWLLAYGRAMRGPEGTPTHIVGIIMDITGRKQSEDILRTSLREKEILLKEVHHRVKNNMQVISSLLSLQSTYVRDQHDAELFHESQMRVKSMAVVHERLYQSADLSSIDFGEYVDTIVTDLVHSYYREGLHCRTSIGSIRFGVDTAIPCGLLINELVTNSVKHAFPDGREGTIEITSTRTGDLVTLTVSDNGVGFPEGIDLSSEATLGMTIIQALTAQLGGTISIESAGGTRVTVTFPLVEQPPLLAQQPPIAGGR